MMTMGEVAMSITNFNIRALWIDENGTAAVEYAVLISVTVTMVVAGFYFYSNAVQILYQELGIKLFG
jgi:Flp pilus assembly pilin Flp